MKNIYLPLLALVFCLNTNTWAISTFNNGNRTSTAKAEKIKEKLKPTAMGSGEFSLSSFAFTENKGQVYGYDGLAHPEVKFVFRQAGTQIFLLEKGIAYQFTKVHYPAGYQELMRGKFVGKNKELLEEMRKQIRTETFRMDMTLVGANNHLEITSEGKSSDYTNFYNRNVLDVHSFNKITYQNIYPGIDWVIYIKNNQIKYDFIVKPGADPSLIKLEFKHQEGLSLDENDSFVLKSSLGYITEKAPVSYQNGHEISTRFVLKKNTLAFSVSKYSKTQTLVIDPAVSWATYFGSTLQERALDCSTDASGNVYMAGYTGGTVGIASGGHQNNFGGGIEDGFLVKYNSVGVLQWASYYGGASGDQAWSCAADASGNIYLAGHTESTANISFGGHQNTYGGSMDAFLAKFNSAGVLQWGTYYGGNSQEPWGTCYCDPSGNVYLTGGTKSTSGIALGGYQNAFSGGTNYDAFLVKFNGSGVVQWGTYYGDLGEEIGRSCATDILGNVFVTGRTSSTINIASGGHQNTFGGISDGFLVKFNNVGGLQWATYYGGDAGDETVSAATDASGNIFLAGYTTSTNNIASGGHQNSYGGGSSDAFLVKFNAGGIRQWATYYGAIGNDVGQGCSTNTAGDVFLTGQTSSATDIASGGNQNTHGGGIFDAFLAKFNNNGIRYWGTYYGGSKEDAANACATDASGNIYVAGLTSSTANIASGGHQNTYIGGTGDAFLVKFCNNPSQPSSIAGTTVMCIGSAQVYSVNNDPAATTYSWNFSGSWTGSSTSHSISVTPVSSGTITVVAQNSCAASLSQTTSVLVNALPTINISATPTLICLGGSSTITAIGATTYSWNNGSNNTSIVASPTITSTYSVSGTDANGCQNSTTMTIVVNACVGIDKWLPGSSQVLAVYPNPNNGVFYIETSQELNVIVFNSLGQIVHQQNLVVGKNKIDLNNQAHGIYFIQINQNGNLSTSKIIKD
jgi:hypothetical protein